MQDDEILVQISLFLTKFGDYFRGNDELLDNSSCRSDVRKAINYQCLLEKRHLFESLRKGAGILAVQPVKPESITKQLQRIKSDIEKTAPEIRKLHRILKRFEILMAQDIAQSIFTTEESTPLLNLPSAASAGLQINSDSEPLRWRLKNELSISPEKTLLLPPNHWTWQEYLRLGFVVSLLPTSEAREKAHLSTVSTFSEKENLRVNGQLSQAEIVALWIRSQRNTSAWRHFTQLFIIEKTPSRLAGPKANSNAEDCQEDEYTAYYAGNSIKQLSTMVRKDASPMDSLVEWSITNQVLFTQQYIEDGLSSGSIPYEPKEIIEKDYTLPSLENNQTEKIKATENGEIEEKIGDKSAKRITESASSREMAEFSSHLDQTSKSVASKRPREKGDEVEHVPGKKQKVIDSTQESLSVLRAKHSYLLRWFLRRNRKATTILFKPKLEEQILPAISLTLLRTLWRNGVVEKVRQILKKEHNSSNRTFARIDRRLQMFKGNEEDETQYFQTAILQALDALKRSTTEELSESSVESAIKDFKRLSSFFLGDSREGEIIKFSKAEEIVPQLLSVQPPWFTSCNVCNDAIEVGEDAVICSNCEKSMHTKCSFAQCKKSLQSLVTESEPLKRIFTIRIPQKPPKPDFSNDTSIKWERLEIKIILSKDRGLRIGVHHTEECASRFKSLISGKENASILKSIYKIPPLKTIQIGLVVTEFLGDSPAVEAGVKEGDFITHVKVPGSDSFTVLSELPQEERIELMKKVSEPLTVLVHRPSIPILQRARAWSKAMQNKANKSGKKFFNTETYQSFCKDCVARAPLNAIRNPVEEAKRCLAVIRRIGMESYSIPFHEEKPFKEGGSHYSLISFRRLEQMMLSIINCQALSAGGYAWAFSVPPHHTEKKSSLPASSEKISWISDKLINAPYELMCRAMQILLTPPIALSAEAEEDLVSQERTALTFHFISLFISWCYRSSFDSKCVLTTGPPTDYSALCSPWLHPTCKYCMLPISRSTENEIETNSSTCSRDACKARDKLKVGASGVLENEMQVVTESSDDSGSNETSPNCPEPSQLMSSTDQRLRQYYEHASYVGSIITILPKDPVLDIPAHFLQQPWIKDIDRPMPFLIASYLPSYFVKLHPGSCIKPSESEMKEKPDGFFYLLPIIYKKQLNYLESLACMRRPPVSLEKKMKKKWANMKILELEGVVCLTPRQLKLRVSQTKGVRQALMRAVAHQASCSNKKELDNIPRKGVDLDCQIICDVLEKEGEDTIRDRMENKVDMNLRLKRLSSQIRATTTIGEGTEDIAARYTAMIDCSMNCQSKRIHNLISLVDASCNEEYKKDLFFREENEKDSNLEDCSARRKQTKVGASKNTSSVERKQLVKESKKLISEAEIVKTEPDTEDAMQIDSVKDNLQKEPAANSQHDKHNSQPSEQEVRMAQLPEREVARTPIRPNEADSSKSIPKSNGVSNTLNSSSKVCINPQPPIQVVDKVPNVSTNQKTAQPAHQIPSQVQRWFKYNDLYMAGPPGTFISRTEAVVVWETINLQYPVLARRLLLPRYSLPQAEEQAAIIERLRHSVLPRLPSDVIRKIWSHDYQRSLKETGPIILSEGECSYRSPHSALPLDVIVSNELRKRAQQGLYEEPREPSTQHNQMMGAAPVYNNSAQHEVPAVPKRSGPPNWHTNTVQQHMQPPPYNQNPYHQPILSPPNMHYNTANNVSYEPARIRGGRPNEYSPKGLQDIPESQRAGKLVTTKINTTKDGSIPVEATIVGFVGKKNLDNDNIDVQVIYVSTHGIFDEPTSHPLPIDILNLVGDGTEESGIVKAWRETRCNISNAASDLAAVAEIDNENSRNSEAYTNPAKENEIVDFLPCEYSNGFGWDWAKNESGTILLGHLPDRRNVYWLPSDPEALFLLHKSESEKVLASQLCKESLSFSKQLIGSEKGNKNSQFSIEGKTRYHCFWGCSNKPPKKSAFVCFESFHELQEHLISQHFYQTLNVGNTSVINGMGIKKLSEDLVAAMVSRCSTLIEMTRNGSSGFQLFTEGSSSLQFDQDKINALIKVGENNALDQIVKDYTGDKQFIKQMVLLWYRIAGIFNIETNGELILKPKSHLKRLKNMEAIGGLKGKHVAISYDCYESNISTDQSQFNQCQLCCTGSEQCIKNVTTSNYLGIGCSLITSLGNRKRTSLVTCQGHTSYYSKAKTLMLHIATTLPKSLRHERVANQQKDRDSVNSEGEPILWDDGRFQYWCKFVEQSDSVNRLTQALITLLRSINKQKLPTWWKSARSGWSKPVALVTSTVSISSLLLHLYVLDAAIAEYRNFGSKKKDHSKKLQKANSRDTQPNESSTRSVAEHMKSIITWAEKLGIERFTGNAHGDYCVTCDDGGDLLCCEYCPTVQHPYCADPPIENPDSISKWVCSGCTKDIAELKEASY